MSKIFKISTGLIFEESFDRSFSPKWDLFPNDIDRVLFNEDSISLLPQKDNPLEMLIPSPNDGKFCIKTEVEYTPQEKGEVGGMIVKSITGYTTECEFEYNELNPNEYKFINLSCNETYVLNLRASKDGVVWEDLGNTRFYDGNYVGFFLNGSGAELKIKNFIMCTDKFIRIQGVKDTDVVEIINSDGENIIEKYKIDCRIKNGTALIDVENIAWPIENVNIVVIKDSCDVSTLNVPLLYGGDVFSFEPELVFSVDEIKQNEDGFYLGDISGSGKAYTLRVYNAGEQQRIGKLVIEPVSSYDEGHHMAYIHPFESDLTTRTKELEVAINPMQEFKCIVRIEKNSRYVTIDDNFRFNIVFK